MIPAMPDELASLVEGAAARDDVAAGVATLYARLAERIARRRPVCGMSGRCCRFEAFGHRLYVTTMELAVFVRELRTAGPPATDGWDGTGCPFQVAGQCGVHAIRPFGCRVFFCDPTAGEWQEALYADHHAEMKRLHETMGVAYRYVEWRTALSALGLARRPRML